MDNLDYQAVGLISGLEVHQQLLTGHKLFCRCPAGLYTQAHDGEILRHMRPTLSELGVYDGTALMEFKTRKEIVYLLNRLNVCTYEMDDTPPFLVNQEAIDVAVELCLMMNMDIIDEVHIARKQYLDGSIPTGFQRTAIVGVDGWMPFKGRKLSVTHLSIEEDSCREVSDKGHRITWRTDRLGMPLTETVTGPDLRTPEEVRDAILLCGLAARSTRRVRVGIGASRQDVNVSVRGGRRVEIKGVPKAGYAVKLVHNEAIRQVNLLRLRGELHARGLREPGDFRTYVQDISEILADAELVFFRKALAEGHRIFGVKVEGVSGLAAHPTQPDTTFLDELAGRVRVIACLDEPPVILCGSHLPEFPNRHRALEKLRRRLRIGPNDEFFLVFGPEQDCHTAAEEIRLRFVDAADGIPQETRQALAGGYTTFERILPGPDRMYPDTDSPPTRVTPERVQKIKAGAHEAPWDRLARYAALGIPEESGCFLIRRGGAEIVDEVARRTGVHGRVVAVEIAQHAKAMRRRGIPMDRLDAEAWTGLFDLYAGGRIPREGLPLVAARMAADGLDAVAAASAEGLEPLGREAWIGEADRVAETEAWAARVEEPGKRLSFLAGQVMARLRGRAPGRDVVHYLREKLEGLES